MHADAYTRFVLTVIAACLVYLCAREAAPPVAAQDAPTRVIIAGVALEHGDAPNLLPVGVVGEMRLVPGGYSALPIQPVSIRAAEPVEIRTTKPLMIDVERPLPVRAVREPGSQRPGDDERQ
jgi:hypothetical protein